MPTLSEGAGRVTRERFAVGHAGRQPTADELEFRSLRESAAAARKTFAGHPCHNCEIRKVQAEQALDDFLLAHPEVAA